MTKEKIAIIGSGISGMAAAYMLHPHHDITVFEKNNYIGGHSRTITLPETKDHLSLDTGFIVYNERNYPLLVGLFKHLGVETIKSDMSFGVSIDKGFLEYGSKGMFAQFKNLFRPKFWGMLIDILYFNKNAERFVDENPNINLADLLDKMKLGEWFRLYYLQAMGAAIWSCSVETILKYPAEVYIRFFKNHGLLTVNNHPQWFTVKGGSKNYVDKITASYRHCVQLNTAIVAIKRHADHVEVHDHQGQIYQFDRVVLAGHADESLAMLTDASDDEKNILSAFTFQSNDLVVHGDETFMPKHKKAWASWVYLSEGQKDSNPSVSLSYWMNNLQSLPAKHPLFVTLNAGRAPHADKVYDRHSFMHPVFTREAIEAQKKIPNIQGKNRTYFCGAWQRYGFHEDGLLSAVNIMPYFNITPPWIKK
jgi:predicted NAD/FAD-binding protein